MNPNALHKRLSLLESAIKEIRQELESEITPPAPRKRRNFKQEAYDRYDEMYRYGKKKTTNSKPTKQAK